MKIKIKTLIIFLVLLWFLIMLSIQVSENINLKSINDNSIKEVNAVLSYLNGIEGEKILSGQMESTWLSSGPDFELNYIKKHTGDYPVIKGLDFIFEEENKGVVKRTINWWDNGNGGIPTIMWHWGNPMVGEGYENSKKEIDINKMLKVGTKEHKKMISDLDRIAKHLKIIQKSKVPVIWRPLHEANGNWFWWSKNGAEDYKKIWRFMYKYFTEEKKLNNLIWFLGFSNEADKKWYPGDEYVDLIGVDTYKNDFNLQQKMYNSTKNITSSKRIVSCHECGKIPDPVLLEKENIDWVWFMAWHSNWLIDNNSPEYIREVYNNDYVVTLSEFPNVMTLYDQSD